MTCRDCDKLEPRGCGKTCCSIDKRVILDFDKGCSIELDAGTNSNSCVETCQSATQN